MKDDQKWRGGGPGRIDVDGVEWWACDPYPTWYRYEGEELHQRRNLEDPAPWADEIDEDKALGLRITVLGPKRRLRRRPVVSVKNVLDMGIDRWDGHPITYQGVFKVQEERDDGTVLVTERVGW